MRWLLLAAASAGVLWGAGSAAELARGVRESRLDPEECYRVRELTAVKEDLRIYFTDGYLIFGKPVNGRRVTAVFTALESEGGDGEVLLMAPNRGERRSLASYTGAPNLNEHITGAMLVFSDGTYDALMEQVRSNPFNRKVPEMGLLLAEKWSATVRNIAASFETRLALDLLSSTREGFFASMSMGRKLGNFDAMFDPRGREQIVVGQMASRDNRAYFDVWTSFEARSWRKGGKPQAAAEFTLADYRIAATVETDLTLNVSGKVKVRPAVVLHAVPLDLSRDMRLDTVTFEGRPAEVLQRDSMRANLVRNTGNDMVLVVPPEPLRPGRDYEMEFHTAGRVIHDAGNEVYYVASRGNWYPNRWMQFATFDLTFRHSRDLDLVMPGAVVEEKTEGEWRITRRRTSVPIRMAGFNLGHYDRVRVTRGGHEVEVCANRNVERALQPRLREPMTPPLMWPRGRRPEVMQLPPEPMPASPRQRLEELASDVSSAVEFMTSRFGPPALPTLTVSPVPGTFGQGFPGLVYLSTLSYLGRQERPVANLSARYQLFFTDLLQPHETAHQWWGNVVASAGYHDDWIMEALANYSALLYVEKRRGARTVDMVLEEYRNNLLTRTEGGETVESAGPVVLGARLESSQSPAAWRAIIYDKGSWILHMLRRQMGDERFLAMLAELRKRYEGKPVSTEQFRELASKFLPPKWEDPDLSAFFDQWVYGTGIPELKLSHTVKGKAGALRVAVTVTQSGVEPNFSTLVPVELQLGRGRTITRWVRTASEPVTFTVAVRQAPGKVSLDPGRAVLRR